WSRTPELSRKERLQKVDAREYPECMEMIMRHEDIMIEDTLNPAAGFKKFARLSATSGRHSLLISGIWRKGRLLGLVSMDFAEKGNKFSSDDFRRLADAGKIFLLAYERKRRLNVIANGHAIQRQICDSLPLPVLLFDLDYNVIAINPEVTASTGLSEQDVIGKKCYKVLCNCDDVPEWCPMRTTLKEKKRVQVDYSGYGHEYIVSTQPVFNHQGELIYVLEIAQDITELKKQEQRLSMQNLLLSNAAAIAKITYIAGGANAQVNIIGGNSEIGMDKNGANSLTDWLFVDDREEFERQFRELNSGDRKEIDMMCRSTATGDMRDYRLQGTRDNKDNELYYGVLLDVTVQVAKSRERREFIKQLNGYVENERIINMVLSQIILDKNFDRNIDEVLQIIATRLNSDRAYFGVFSGKEHNCTFSREWLSDGVLSLKSVKNPQFYEFFSQWDSRFNGEELLTIPDVRNSEYAQAFSESGCRTLVCAPIWVNKELYGILGVGFIHCIREISDLELNIIRSAARLISLSRERQIQRESLEALDHQNRLILSSMPIPVCLFDRDGKLIHSNPAASTLAGKTEEEMIKHPCFESLCGFDGPPEFCPVHHVLKDGKPYVHDIEIGKRMYQVSAMPIFDLNDRIVNVIEILVDLSEIIESKRKLEIAVKAAQDADSAKSVFLATMSHEMRTPLNAVIGFSELLKTESLPLDERSEYVASINLAGNSLLKLLNDVLDLSKIEAEQMEIVPTPIGIDKILKEIVAIFQYKIQEKKLFCHLEIPDDLPILMLDELRLRQILLNVVGNAVKFTENGGVTLTVDFQRKEKNRGDLAIMIKDTGIGIAPEIQSRIFLPFVQQDSARDSRIFNGTGLGLTIAHRFAVIMGGDIKVKSEPGKGSVFTIELPGIPYELGTPGEQGKKAKKTGVTLPKMKLLLVDDVIMNLKVLQAMCKKLGMECVCANSGEEALSILRGGEKFDAVLTDLWMPKMNGTELAKQISNDESLAEVSVIAVTADTQLATTLPKDFCGALTKPITPETLSKIIEESLTSGKKKKRGGK
ncbi:MAG: PAS domain-containing protein, partial [Victivallales bacterium]|nr:PAS domain-containing protein [Victivallales bacterium]